MIGGGFWAVDSEQRLGEARKFYNLPGLGIVLSLAEVALVAESWALCELTAVQSKQVSTESQST